MEQTLEMKALTEELMADEDFVKNIEQAKTEEEYIEAFTEKGIDVTSEDLADTVKELSSRKSGELNEEDLEVVQGGVIISAALARMLIIYGIIVVVGLLVSYWQYRKLKNQINK